VGVFKCSSGLVDVYVRNRRLAMMMNGARVDLPSLTVNASGTAVGCGVTNGSTLSFSGTLAP